MYKYFLIIFLLSCIGLDIWSQNNNIPIQGMYYSETDNWHNWQQLHKKENITIWQNKWHINPIHELKIETQHIDTPIGGVKITLLDKTNTTKQITYTNNNGIAYVFPMWQKKNKSPYYLQAEYLLEKYTIEAIKPDEDSFFNISSDSIILISKRVIIFFNEQNIPKDKTTEINDMLDSIKTYCKKQKYSCHLINYDSITFNKWLKQKYVKHSARNHTLVFMINPPKVQYSFFAHWRWKRLMKKYTKNGTHYFPLYYPNSDEQTMYLNRVIATVTNSASIVLQPDGFNNRHIQELPLKPLPLLIKNILNTVN